MRHKTTGRFSARPSSTLAVVDFTCCHSRRGNSMNDLTTNQLHPPLQSDVHQILEYTASSFMAINLVYLLRYVSEFQARAPMAMVLSIRSPQIARDL
jgi:hypothetical protein